MGPKALFELFWPPILARSCPVAVHQRLETVTQCKCLVAAQENFCTVEVVHSLHNEKRSQAKAGIENNPHVQAKRNWQSHLEVNVGKDDPV